MFWARSFCEWVQIIFAIFHSNGSVQVFEKHICAYDAVGFLFFHFFQLAWFSLTNLLFGMWFLSAVSLSDTFDMLWCSHIVSSRGIAPS